MNSLVIILLIIAVVFIAIAMVWWVLKRKSVSVNKLYSEALDAIIKGKNSQAIKLLKQVVNKDSDNIGAYLHLGNLLRTINPQQAAKIHQSLTIRPKLNKHISQEIHQSLALDYAEMQDYKRAKIEAELVLKSNKNNVWANQFLLQMAEKLHDWESAGRIAATLQKITGKRDNRQLAEIHCKAGEDYFDRNELKKALAQFNKAIKIDPVFSKAYAHIGNIYEEEKNLKKALINWEKSLSGNEIGDSKVYKKLETALFELGKFNEAENIYNKILKNNPDESRALQKLTQLLKEKNDIDGALKLIDKTLINGESIVGKLIKIKLLLGKANSVDLSNQIDEVIEMIHQKN